MTSEKNNENAKTIEELEKILNKELEVDEDIDFNEFEQQKNEIEKLKKEIDNVNNSNNISDDYRFIESKPQIIDKCLEDIKEQLNSNYNKYNIIFNKKIEDLKKDIFEQANAHINEQFEEILNEIKKIHTNENINEIIEDKKINLEEINTSDKKNNKVSVSNNNTKNNRISNNKIIKRKKNDDNISSNNPNILNEIKNKNNENRNSLFNEGKSDRNEINDDQISELENVDEFNEGDSVKNKINNFNLPHKINAERFINKPYNLRNMPRNNDKKNPNPFSSLNKDKKEKEVRLKVNTILSPNNNNNDKAKKIKDNNAINNKIYQSINNIFFMDYQQKYVNNEKINDIKKEQLKDLIFKDKKNGAKIFKKYYMNFIEVNVLPLFRKNKDHSNLNLEAIKYNISVILECLEMDKNYYNNYYYQYEMQKKPVNRNQSMEAVRKFRKEFGISKEDYKDEAIEKRLIENDLDIYKTFGKMFG